MVNAQDVITYVGIPLAVLGVLPIFYTCIRSTLALRSIRHALKANGLSDTAITRGSLMSGIIEVEIPRRRITPLDRELDPAYWTVSAHQISLPGGTWAIFPWNQILTGRTLYRCQYKEELRVPPAEISFEELVAFLLDRGAIPDPKGWKVLKSIGLWTPTGTILLRGPVNGSPVLKLAPPYDGDGILRLAVYWDSRWDRRNISSLPPFWMRLDRPRWRKLFGARNLVSAADTDMGVDKLTSQSTIYDPTDNNNKNPSQLSEQTADEASQDSPLPPELLAKIEELHASLHTGASSDSIRFHAQEGLVRCVHFEQNGMLTEANQPLWGVEDSATEWFTWAACALSQKSDSGLWNISIPSHVSTFAKGSIPGGVVVLLEIVGENDVPPFAGPPPGQAVDWGQRHQKFLEGTKQRMLENQMPPAQAEEARRQRIMAETQSFHNQHMQNMRAKKEYEERRVIGALNSQPLTTPTLAEKTRLHLISENIIPSEYTLDDLARAVLYLMIVSRDEARGIKEVLEKWLAWSQQGGMNQQHLEFLKANKLSFCYASALVAVIETTSHSDSQSSSDLMECLKIWQTVHLG